MPGSVVQFLAGRLRFPWGEKPAWGKERKPGQQATRSWASSTGHSHVPEAHGQAGRQAARVARALTRAGGRGGERLGTERVAGSTRAGREVFTQKG